MCCSFLDIRFFDISNIIDCSLMNSQIILLTKGSKDNNISFSCSICSYSHDSPIELTLSLTFESNIIPSKIINTPKDIFIIEEGGVFNQLVNQSLKPLLTIPSLISYDWIDENSLMLITTSGHIGFLVINMIPPKFINEVICIGKEIKMLNNEIFCSFNETSLLFLSLEIKNKNTGIKRKMIDKIGNSQEIAALDFQIKILNEHIFIGGVNDALLIDKDEFLVAHSGNRLNCITYLSLESKFKSISLFKLVEINKIILLDFSYDTSNPAPTNVILFVKSQNNTISMFSIVKNSLLEICIPNELKIAQDILLVKSFNTLLLYITSESIFMLSIFSDSVNIINSINIVNMKLKKCALFSNQIVAQDELGTIELYNLKNNIVLEKADNKSIVQEGNYFIDFSTIETKNNQFLIILTIQNHIILFDKTFKKVGKYFGLAFSFEILKTISLSNSNATDISSEIMQDYSQPETHVNNISYVNLIESNSELILIVENVNKELYGYLFHSYTSEPHQSFIRIPHFLVKTKGNFQPLSYNNIIGFIETEEGPFFIIFKECRLYKSKIKLEEELEILSSIILNNSLLIFAGKNDFHLAIQKNLFNNSGNEDINNALISFKEASQNNTMSCSVKGLGGHSTIKNFLNGFSSFTLKLNYEIQKFTSFPDSNYYFALIKQNNIQKILCFQKNSIAPIAEYIIKNDEICISISSYSSNIENRQVPIVIIAISKLSNKTGSTIISLELKEVTSSLAEFVEHLDNSQILGIVTYILIIKENIIVFATSGIYIYSQFNEKGCSKLLEITNCKNFPLYSLKINDYFFTGYLFSGLSMHKLKQSLGGSVEIDELATYDRNEAIYLFEYLIKKNKPGSTDVLSLVYGNSSFFLKHLIYFQSEKQGFEEAGEIFVGEKIVSFQKLLKSKSEVLLWTEDGRLLKFDVVDDQYYQKGIYIQDSICSNIQFGAGYSPKIYFYKKREFEMKNSKKIILSNDILSLFNNLSTSVQQKIIRGVGFSREGVMDVLKNFRACTA